MKLAIRSTIALGSFVAAEAADYAPFQITSLATHQPNGNPAGQVNYYHIEFNVTSANDGASEQAYCWASWGDNNNNCDTSCVAYSTAVPTGNWIPCVQSPADLGDTTSTNFSFQLYPRFSIGNFSVAVQQILSSGSSSTIVTTQSSPYTITNTSTSDLICDINPREVYLQQHAQGDCQTPPDYFSGFSLPITVSAACDTSSPLHLSFPVQERTTPGESVWVTGNISALGNWNPAQAVPLNNSRYNDISTLWSGGDAVVPVGTPFEYVYFQKNVDGSLLWECGENRTWTAEFSPLDGCAVQTVGNDPDYFRCGNH